MGNYGKIMENPINLNRSRMCSKILSVICWSCQLEHHHCIIGSKGYLENRTDQYVKS